MKKIIITNFLIGVIFLVSLLIMSIVSQDLWTGPKEGKIEVDLPLFSPDETIELIQEKHHISDDLIQKALQIDLSDKHKTLQTLNLDPQNVKTKLESQLAIMAEHGSKDWKKILIKFALWLSFIGMSAWLIRHKKLNRLHRLFLYGSSALLFGVVLGSDPSPMGTVADAVVLGGKYKAIFPPRMIALAIFLLTVIVFNKAICAWGCQFGTTQDFLFRLFRNSKDSKGIIRQYKPPFWISNSIRIMVFIAMTLLAFLIGFDLMEHLNPFKLFHPTKLMLTTSIFLVVILGLSTITYRPFCHFVCPFGLVGWLFEKLSFFKIRVNKSTCISCNACTKACPTSVMSAILNEDKKVIPDCFSCGNCISVCPTNAVQFRRKKDL